MAWPPTTHQDVQDAVGKLRLTPTATQTAAYTAAANELAMMNVAGGATALTLPTAPPDQTRVGYRAIGASTATPLTINRGGATDTIGTTGATTASVVMADETVVLQYDAANTRWLGVAAVRTQASLDARYDAAGAAAAVLPAQTGNSGKYLTTNGTAASWAAVAGGGGGTGLDATTFTSVTCSGGSTSFGGFVTVPCSTVVSDPGAHWDNVNYQYVVPTTGTYLIIARFRPTDSSTAGKNLGMGVHTSNSDGAWFQWQSTSAATRFTENYQRIDAFAAGDRLRLYVYWDSTATTGIVAAALQIIRVF